MISEKNKFSSEILQIVPQSFINGFTVEVIPFFYEILLEFLSFNRPILEFSDVF